VISAHVPGCTGKAKYGDEGTALFAIEKMRKSARRAPPKTMNAYRCTQCRCWHVTHWTPEQQEAALRVTRWREWHAKPLWQRVRDVMEGTAPARKGAS